MKQEFLEGALEIVTKGLGLLTVASGILFITALGSLSNSCNNPNLVYYYTDMMRTTAISCFSFSIGFMALYLIKEFGHKEEMGFGWILERTIVEIVGISFAALIFSIACMVCIMIVIGSFNIAMKVPLRDVPQSISFAEFCKDK